MIRFFSDRYALWIWTSLVALFLPLLGIQQCDDGDDTPTPDPYEGQDTTVVAFDGIHQYYGNGDTRTVSTVVEFPDEMWLYERILLNYTLACPEGGCDPWDRLAYVTVIQEGQPATQVEVGRFITPYGVGGSWSLDVTDLRPILAGSRTVTSFIDTWVNPGWLVDVSFTFEGGVPERKATGIVPLWVGYYSYGNPTDPISSHLTEISAMIPSSATGASLWVLATGHGQGNTENCAEFCAKEHTLQSGAASDTLLVWRDDCATSGVPGQSGTFWYSRAGWCPGDDVIPRTWDISDTIVAGSSARLQYQVEDYVNYETDSGSPPYLVISSYLILFE